MKHLKINALFMIYLVIAISGALYFPEPVSAANPQACCQRTTSGDYCRYTDATDCDSNYLVASNIYCDNVDFCKVGCCYDTVEGNCYQGVAKSGCESSSNSVWNPDPQCNIDQCQLGCCQISNQCSLSTQTKCRATASQYPDVEMIFSSSVTDEQACVDLCRGTDEGACISQDGSCLRTTRTECTERFELNKLCSHPDLGTNCAPQQTTECVGEDVYWFDSCGNKENIYNSNKRVSYNSGFIQSEDQVPRAQPNDQNLGNCDYLTGTLCGEALGVSPAFGNYICRDMDCYDVFENSASPNSGGNKRHGESWCIYETAVGPGKDVVGSRHRKSMCINGEEIIDECTDFREEYCIQNIVGDQQITEGILTLFSEELQGYTEATCKDNRFADCSSCGSAGCCNDEKKDCIWVNYGQSTQWKSGKCVPLVPPGLKFWDSTASSTCSRASQSCEVKYEKNIGTGWRWECVENCHCKDQSWIRAANQYCKSQGDCGSYYNIEGRLTLGGYSRTGTRNRIGGSDLPSWSTIMNPSAAQQAAISYENEDYFDNEETSILYYTLGGLAAAGATIWISLGGLQTGGISSVAGPVTLIVLAVIFLLGAILVDEDTDTITFSCEPWAAPKGGDDCEKCNARDFECTEYICKSLGRNCELINKGTSDQQCASKEVTDSASPFITPGEMSLPITEQQNGFEIQGLVPPFTPVVLNLETDEPAYCKYDFEPLKDFDEMENNFGSSLYLYEHEVIVPIPSEVTLEENLLATNGGIYQLYIRCEDAIGNKNQADYSIKFQIDPGPDQTPPSIDRTLPDNNSPVPYGEEEYEVTFLLNEPADCKWSLVDKDYEQMENTFIFCSQISSVYYPGLYECKTPLTGIKQNQLNTYYIRCEDKSNNILQQSYQFNLLSTPPLQIISTKPEGKIYTRYPVLEVVTGQGAENGKALCAFSDQDVSLTNMLVMFNTNSTEHSQQLQTPGSGVFNYFIKCVDIAGNLAEEKISFNLEAGVEATQIYNIYKDTTLNILHISTSEVTSCEYAEQPFTFGTGSPMTQPDSTEHTANLGLSVYHIICQDNFDNQQSVLVYP